MSQIEKIKNIKVKDIEYIRFYIRPATKCSIGKNEVVYLY